MAARRGARGGEGKADGRWPAWRDNPQPLKERSRPASARLEQDIGATKNRVGAKCGKGVGGDHLGGESHVRGVTCAADIQGYRERVVPRVWPLTRGEAHRGADAPRKERVKTELRKDNGECQSPARGEARELGAHSEREKQRHDKARE